MSIRDLEHFGLFARTRKPKAWWLMRRVLFALSAMLFLCPVIVRTGGTRNRLPAFSYTGNYSLVNDGGGNWRVKFLTSGTFIPEKTMYVDVFLVGAGGGGGASGTGAGGGGGGYTNKTAYLMQAGVSYSIVIGAGGVRGGGTGGTTSAFNATASGGYGTANHNGGNGGSGGGGSSTVTAAGGTNGANGESAGTGVGGIGQGTTTREFHEPGGALYGSGGAAIAQTYSGAANSGDGGGGAAYTGYGVGGSGIVVIRNQRAA